MPFGFEFVFLKINVLGNLRKKNSIEVVSYVFAIGNLKYVMPYSKPNVCFAIGIVSGY